MPKLKISFGTWSREGTVGTAHCEKYLNHWAYFGSGSNFQSLGQMGSKAFFQVSPTPVCRTPGGAVFFHGTQSALWRTIAVCGDYSGDRYNWWGQARVRFSQQMLVGVLLGGSKGSRGGMKAVVNNALGFLAAKLLRPLWEPRGAHVLRSGRDPFATGTLGFAESFRRSRRRAARRASTVCP